MSSHQLGLNILDVREEKLFQILDASVYDTLLPIVCPELLITVPGFQTSASIAPELLTQGFNLRLTACDLEIQNVRCDSEMWELPDGIYAIRYSLSPSEYIKVEYNHLRLTKAYIRLDKIRCNLDLNDCLPDKNKKDKMVRIAEVEEYLKSAKAKVEYCHESKKGMKLYEYALKLMDKIDCKYC